MARGDDYRIKAADMQAKAREESNPQLRAELERLVLSYLRLADQADRGIIYDVHLGPIHPPHPTQQQQQPQPKKDDEKK